jgi:hypothetical protein
MLFSSVAYLSKSKRFLCNALHLSAIALLGQATQILCRPHRLGAVALRSRPRYAVPSRIIATLR